MVVGKSTTVEFKSGMLLSKEMLEQLEYQTHLGESQYSGYPDGIIYGLIPYEENKRLFFSPGLVKLKGKFFYIHTCIDIYSILEDADMTWDKGTVHSAIILEAGQSALINEGVSVKEIHVKLVDHSAIQDNMLCLAEFQYYKGKRDWDIKNSDLQAQLNTTGIVFSLINVQYSLNGESVFSPYIFGMMKKYLEQIESPSMEDYVLLFLLCQNRLVTFDSLRQWFSCKKINVDFRSRADIIDKFLKGVSTKKIVSHPTTPPPKQSIPDDGFGL